jgi:hypothetical protein
MAQLCKDNAAVRYSTGVRQVDISHFEQFQGSYELSGKTARNERLSVLLTRTDSFCIFPCAKRAHGGAYFRNFPKQSVSYCISRSQRVYWLLPLNPHVSSTKSYAKV